MERQEAIRRLNEIIGQELHVLANQYNVTIYNNQGRVNKGWAGHVFERHLELPINSAQSPNFGSWELKSISLKTLRNGNLKVKETMAITMIDPINVMQKEFEESHLLSKLKKAVIVARTVGNNVDEPSYIHSIIQFDLAPNGDLYNTIKNDYNLYKDFDVRLPPVNKDFLLRNPPIIKASYDVKEAEELRDTLSRETDTFIKLYHNGRENFLSIINTLKQVIVKVHSGENNEASIITTIQDYMYNSHPPKLDDMMTIKFNYDDILIKINGSFVPVTAKNLKFIYDYKHLTFKELLEKHNNKEIKSHLGELPK